MSYENKHVLRGGANTLYNRNAQPTYHCRLKIDGHKGYIVNVSRLALIEMADDPGN